MLGSEIWLCQIKAVLVYFIWYQNQGLHLAIRARKAWLVICRALLLFSHGCKQTVKNGATLPFEPRGMHIPRVLVIWQK